MTTFKPRSLMAVAAIGVIGCGVGLLLDPATTLASYLVAWFAVGAIPIGALAVLLTTYLVRAGWTRDLHKPLASAALTAPVMALLFLPILFGLNLIYPWVSDSGLPTFKAAYLNPGLFALRAMLYFAIWSALAVWAAGAYPNDAAMKRAGAAGLIVWTLTSSWAVIDWLESVEPPFHSSIYGLLGIDFFLLAGFAFGVTALLAPNRTRTMSNASYSGTLLAVLLLWAYMHAMQYIIIWTGNIPAEVVWYLKRLESGWGFALGTLFVAQFVLPFFMLLPLRMRSSTTVLLALAIATLVLRVLEAAVLVLPALGINAVALALGLPAALLTTGACFLLGWQAAPQLLARWSGRAAAIH